MNISKNILTIVFVLSTTTLLFGQREFNKDKIKSLKVAYITERSPGLLADLQCA